MLPVRLVLRYLTANIHTPNGVSVMSVLTVITPHMLNFIAKLDSNAGLALGAVIGLSISALLFFTVPVYHAYMLWSLHHFWWLAACAIVGAYIAYRSN